MRSLDEDVVDYWGAGNLQRWPERAVSQTDLPEPSKAFLVQVGLPLPEKMWSPTKWNLRLPLDRKAKGRRVLADQPRHLVGEHDGGVIRASTMGHPGGFREAFANSSIELFALAITERHKAAAGVWPYVETTKSSTSVEEQTDKWLANLSLFAQRVSRFDPPAMASEATAWAEWVRYETFYVN